MVLATIRSKLTARKSIFKLHVFSLDTEDPLLRLLSLDHRIYRLKNISPTRMKKTKLSKALLIKRHQALTKSHLAMIKSHQAMTKKLILENRFIRAALLPEKSHYLKKGPKTNRLKLEHGRKANATSTMN